MTATADDEPVVVTGMGAVTAAGTGLDALWTRLCRPPDDGPPAGPAGFDPEPWVDRRTRRRTTAVTWYAAAAAALALDDAALVPDPWRTGITLATVYPAMELVELGLRALDGGEAAPMHLAPETCENAAAAHLAIAHGIKGPNRTIVGACAGGGHAIGDAVDQLRLGRSDVVLAGGSQAPLHPALAAGYRAMRVVSASGQVRPFDRRRDGSWFTDGAAVLVLERRSHALARGVTPLAVIAGHANTCDADNMVASSPDGVRACLAAALQDARTDPSEVAGVIAHGTATRMNDDVEAQVLADLLPHRPPVTSVKRALGHGVSTAGVLNVIAAVLALRHGLLPPVAVDHEPDPALPIDVVADSPRPLRSGPLVVNAFGLGGANSSIVVRAVGD